MNKIFVTILAIGISIARETKFLLVLNRHGARTSYAPIDDSFEPGELTPNGHRMSYILGQSLKNRFKDFFPEKFNANNNLVLSSESRRCRLSAQAIITGIYDFGTLNEEMTVDFNFQKPNWNGDIVKPDFNTALREGLYPIPIHSFSQEENYVFQSYSFACPKIMESNINEDPRENKAILDSLNEFLLVLKSKGFNYFEITKKEQIDNVREFMDVVDYIISKKYRGVDFGLSEEIFENVVRLEIATYYYVFFRNQQTTQFMFTELGREIVKYLEKAQKEIVIPNSEKKFVLMSGHDLNILTILISAKLVENECHKKAPAPCTLNPEFSSAITFEVYEEDGKNFIETKLNEKKIKICKNVERNEDCSLEVFISEFKGMMLSGEVEELRDEFCRLETKSQNKLLGFMILFNVSAAVVFWFIIKKQKTE